VARGYIRKPFTPEQVKEHVVPVLAGESVKSVSELLAADDSHGNWIPLLDTAAREVFELMLSCQTDRSSHGGGDNDGCHCPWWDWRDNCAACLASACDRKTAALMTSKMLGVALDKVGPEVSDALGEILQYGGWQLQETRLPALAERLHAFSPHRNHRQ